MKRYKKSLASIPMILLFGLPVAGCATLDHMEVNISQTQKDASEAQKKAEQKIDQTKKKVDQAKDKIESKKPNTGRGTTSVGKAPTGSALAALASIPVEDDYLVQYDRAKYFGKGFVNLDGSADGCDSRQKAYKRDMTNIVMKPDHSCKVQSAVLPVDSYTLEKNVQYRLGRGADVDIDHRVTLEDAMKHGLGTDTNTTGKQQKVRLQFANDPYNLITVSSSSNRQKSYRTIDEWETMGKKINRRTGEPVKVQLVESQKCLYVSYIVGIKGKYNLSMTKDEFNASKRILNTCPSQQVPADPNMSWEK